MEALRRIVGVFGAINIAGGAAGFAMAGSVWSLVIGGGAGLALLILMAIAGSRPAFAWRAAGLLVLGLAGFWVYRITELRAAEKSIGMAAGNLLLALVVFAMMLGGHLAAVRKRA